MILLPIGLGVLPRRIPILTVIIIVLNVFFSISEFPMIEKVQDISYKRKDQEEMSEHYKKILVEICESDLPTDKCRTIEKFFLGNCEFDCVRDVNEDRQITEFIDYWFGKDFTRFKDTKNLKSVKDFQQIKEKAKLPFLKFYKAHNYLSPDNVNIPSLIKAQFIHGDLSHLLGNMFFILVFGAFVEMRVSALFFFLIYFLGGFTGLMLQAMSATDKTVFILGASANASALVGAFYFLFLRKDILFFISLIFYNKIVRVPVLWSIPILYVAKDFSGWLLSWHAEGGVAYLAHLAGFGIGGAAALMLLRSNPIRSPMVFPFEAQMLDDIASEPDFEVKLKKGLKLLRFNPDNHEVIADLLREAFIYLKQNPYVDLTRDMRHFFRTHTTQFLAMVARRKLFEQYDHIIQLAPPDFDFGKNCGRLGQLTTLAMGDHFVHKKDWILAIKFYDLFIFNYRRTRVSRLVQRTIENIFSYLRLSLFSPNDVDEKLVKDVKEYLQTLDSIEPAIHSAEVGTMISNIKSDLLPFQVVKRETLG